MSDPSRLRPLPHDQWSETIADMRSGFAGGLNVYRTMAHHPALLRAWSELRDHVVKHSALGDELLEVVILRIGHRLGSTYEWSQHIERARTAGLSDARIASIQGPRGSLKPLARKRCSTSWRPWASIQPSVSS